MSFRNVEDVGWLANIWRSFIDVIVKASDSHFEFWTRYLRDPGSHQGPFFFGKNRSSTKLKSSPAPYRTKSCMLPRTISLGPWLLCQGPFWKSFLMSFRNVEDVGWLPNIWRSFIDVSVSFRNLKLSPAPYRTRSCMLPRTIS